MIYFYVRQSINSVLMIFAHIFEPAVFCNYCNYRTLKSLLEIETSGNGIIGRLPSFETVQPNGRLCVFSDCCLFFSDR